MRISTPIDNDPECQNCHGEPAGHLGVLLIDVSLVDAQSHLINDLRMDLSLTLIFTLVVTYGVYFLIHRLVVHRVERFREPIEALARGDFSARLPIDLEHGDEIDTLAATANRMAFELERHVEAQEARHQLRHQAIVEERERISREIHDGIAQLMGYVNNKAGAARLLLRQGREAEAQSLLEQLDTASQQAFTELRAAILNLRTSDSPGSGLIDTLRAYASSFSELTDIQVDIAMPVKNNWKLSPDTELHLLRIAQESLSNVQKHAHTKNAWIHLNVSDGLLELYIGDDGVGFDLNKPFDNRRPHFGLNNMRERAESIGASFELDSEPHGGTRVRVRLPLDRG
jgi:signal transduction histidine kinase